MKKIIYSAHPRGKMMFENPKMEAILMGIFSFFFKRFKNVENKLRPLKIIK